MRSHSSAYSYGRALGDPAAIDEHWRFIVPAAIPETSDGAWEEAESERRLEDLLRLKP